MHVALGVFRDSHGVVRSGYARESPSQSSDVETVVPETDSANQASAAVANFERLLTLKYSRRIAGDPGD